MSKTNKLSYNTSHIFQNAFQSYLGYGNPKSDDAYMVNSILNWVDIGVVHSM